MSRGAEVQALLGADGAWVCLGQRPRRAPDNCSGPLEEGVQSLGLSEGAFLPTAPAPRQAQGPEMRQPLRV